MQIQQHLKTLGDLVNDRLDELLDTHCDDGILKDAMRYSLMAGGKRLRPALCLMSAGLFGNQQHAIDIACALEMIHTYSLIHDDLPAMDNDDLRRGKPTNHVVFGEAYAILAGDGLLNLAFEVMLKSAEGNKDSGLNYLGAMNIVGKAAGVQGMILGQVGDMAFEGKDKDEEALTYIHERKTAALIKASVLSGAALLGADDEAMGLLETYGERIGLVFQIVDDILDEVGDEEKMGKTLGKDAKADKHTFASLYGIERSRELAREKTHEALAALECFGDKAEHLKELALYLKDRDR